ncbi:AraC family transcriptional regulator [Amphritea japonica]|uniref:AraC family transcriptional regulator n=1 Tax=Amphritea japonica ATCC BAA-1530 TaxID=1278309 RepID=A0A7R6P4G5_9GAMM|nr:AraC family transcriptional regulator [Amphritea japonica]BBB27123.1 AraC family transcriptional regulator [Amphritea japonica ATCC BAA-1530]
MDTENFLNRRLNTIHPIALVGLLKEKGFGLSQILALTSINPELLKSANHQITYSQYRQLIQNAISLTNNPALGLEFGHRLNISGSGVINMGIMAASNIHDALLFCERTTEVINPSVSFVIKPKGSCLTLEIIERLPWGDTGHFMVDTAFAVLASIINLLDPLIIQQMKFNFMHPVQAPPSYYQINLPDATIQFETNTNSFSLPLDSSQRSLPTFNPQTVEQAEKILEKQILRIHDKRLAITLPIRQMILESEGEMISNEKVAQRFNISSRTLNRRLKSFGTSFSDIVAEVRYSVARDLLKNSSDSIDQIAYKLGYSDSSNFSKAFKIWSDKTPTQFRESSEDTSNNKYAS